MEGRLLSSPRVQSHLQGDFNGELEASWSLETPRRFVDRTLWREMLLQWYCIGKASPFHTCSFWTFAYATATGCMAAPAPGISRLSSLPLGILYVCPRLTLGCSWAHSNLTYPVFKMVLRSAGPTLPQFPEVLSLSPLVLYLYYCSSLTA